MSNIFKNNSRFAGLIDKPEYDKYSTSVKLMKKMGWKEGNGLGKNQDGIKTQLHVEKRENNIGIGFEADEKKINTFNSFKSENKLSKLHLFIKAPSVFAMVLGHRLNGICDIQLYDWVDGQYIPTAELNL